MPSVPTRRPAVAALLGALLCIASLGAAAQSRIVIVNGKLLSDPNLARLEQMHCSRIPDGSYWLDGRTGAWGHAGNPQVQGVLGDPCRATGPNQDGTYGPYATAERAKQVADGYRRRGLQANWFHNGDGYYVRVGR